jgi:hypothetical protein
MQPFVGALFVSCFRTALSSSSLTYFSTPPPPLHIIHLIHRLSVAAAHAQLGLYHHKLGSLESVPRHVNKEVAAAAAAAGGGGGGGVSAEDNAAAENGENGEEGAAAASASGGGMRSCVNLDRRLDRAARHMAAAAFLYELLGE